MNAINSGIGFLVGSQVNAAIIRAWGHRSGRVFLLVPAIWVLNLVDLLFTLHASREGLLIELNPIAANLSDSGLVLLKLAALLLFTATTLAFCRCRCTLWGCYLLMTVYGLLAIVWFTRFGFFFSPFHSRYVPAAW